MTTEQLRELRVGDWLEVSPRGSMRPPELGLLVAGADHPDLAIPMFVLAGLPVEWPLPEPKNPNLPLVARDERRRYPPLGLHTLWPDEIVGVADEDERIRRLQRAVRVLSEAA